MMTSAVAEEPTAVDVRDRAPARRSLIPRILGQRRAVAGLFWIVLVVLSSIVAVWWTPHGPLEQDLANSFSLPTPEHLLGTDQLGRDILSRLMYGASDTLIGAALATGVALVIGVPLGILAGYWGRWLDAIVSRLADLLLTIPAIIVLLMILAIFGNSMNLAMIALGVLMSSQFVRIARASALALKNELFVDAARVFGITNLRIIFRHLLPNIGAPLIIQGAIILSVSILLQTSLGFLGLGTKPPYPSWGQMVGDASQQIYTQPWLMVPAGVVIMLTIFAFNLIGDATRDSLVEAEASSVLSSSRPPRASRRDRTHAAAGAVDMPDDAVVSIRDLTVSFPVADETVDVVRGVSFDVARGCATALVGESGSGKTMTALSILGLIPHPGYISRASILFDGRDLAAGTEKDYRSVRGSKIGLISQEPMLALDPSYKVRTHLREVLCGIHKMSRAAADRRALELLALVELPDPELVYNSYPHQLSGGMAQRVSIAWALAGDPEVLIADEPTTALDVTVQAGILDLLRKLMDELGMTVILLTHDLGVVADLCSDVVVMQGGRVVETADVRRIFTAPEHEYTQTLLGHARALDRDAGKQALDAVGGEGE